MSLFCGSSQEPRNTATTIQHAIMIFERRMFASVNHLE
jgi:hypothetical protein